MKNIEDLKHVDIVNSLGEGVYVCNLERRITYWSKSAERITGWRSEEVVGRQCFDSVLCHEDKDGHRLCGKEYCPLHRSMVTGSGTSNPLLVYAQGADGGRIPMRVSTSPIHDEDGRVIGGVETFSDARAEVHDLEKAKTIQRLALERDLPEDSRVTFKTHYIPHDIVGGDYYAIERLGPDLYGVMLADVTGHGVAAALYTMHLSQLWDRLFGTLNDPVGFTCAANKELVKVFKSDASFATAVYGVFDLAQQEFRFVGAGGPPVLLMHADGTSQSLDSPGFPLAIMADAEYEEVVVKLVKGDRLLFFSDGAVEVMNAAGAELGADGLLDILRAQGYPDNDIDMTALEEELLRYSNAIRLADDLTLIEFGFGVAS